MTVPSQRRRGPAFVGWVLVAAAVWWIVAEGDPRAWTFGVPLVGAAAAWAVTVFPPAGARLRPVPFIRFTLLFGRDALLSGWDVARRAFRPDMGLRPAYTAYSLRLPVGLARYLFVHAITLMPGTLSVLLEGDTLRVHVLDDRLPVQEGLARLERAAGAVTGLTVSASQKGGDA